MEKGKLIVIEGACDGIGKSTQIERLIEHLEKDGEKVYHHHFPTYDSYQGEMASRYLKGEYGSPSELSPYFVNSIYAIDRAITWYKDLKQKYEEGETILLDRYTTSTLIYQTALIEDIEERKKAINYMLDLEYNKIGIKEPDQIIFLNASFDIVNNLRSKREHNEGVTNDIHERNLDFLRKVYENALFVADYFHWDKVECVKDEQMRSITDIHNDVYNLVRSK